jgi:hypothetical protein
MSSDKGERLRALCAAAAAHGRRSHPAVAAALAALGDLDPAGLDQAEQALRAGLEEHDAVEAVFHAATRHGPDHPETAVALEALGALGDRARRAGEAARQRGADARRQATWERERLLAGEQLSTVHPRAEHRLDRLPASPAWTIAIGPAANDRHIALLLPGETALPAIGPLHPGWLPPGEVDANLQLLLDLPAGILGVRSSGDGPREILRWVLRLLPLDGPTSLDIVPGPGTPEIDWQASTADLLCQYAAVDAGRHALLHLHSVREPVTQESGFLALLALLARIWNDPSRAGAERRARSGLLACLADGDPALLRRLWDELWRGVAPEGSDWAALLRDPAAAVPDSLPALMLDRLAAVARSDLALWERYRDHAYRHLDSKAIHFENVARELDWLRRARPPEADALPPRMKLSWLTTQLAAGNTTGATDAELQAEARALCDELFDEDAPLVCQAELRLAVRETNRFAFAAASQALARWESWPVAVPGRQLWARVRSSLGQHAAFRGEYAQARAYFDEALAAFGELSDEQTAALEWGQTATYRAIATMDDPGRSAEDARATLAALIGLERRAILAMAASDSPAEQYRHHTLLRYLVYRGTPCEQDAYLTGRREWKARPGHPWELIQTYRAILLHARGDRDGACDLIREAQGLVCDPRLGPTLRFIAAVLGVVGAGWGVAWPGAKAQLDELEHALPLARPYIAATRAALEQAQRDPVAAPELLRTALPFNFH